MKIISWNVNGIRSAIKQGFWDWFNKTNADIVCLQELKINSEDFDDLDLPKGYFITTNFADKKGYSSLAVFSKVVPLITKLGLGDHRFDHEGRYLELDFGDFILINIYLPHGGRQKENLEYKLSAYQKLFVRLRQLKNKKVIIIGDFNIAHTELDLARPKNNKNNIMFTEDERRQLDKIIKFGFVDSFRKYHPEGGHYTWWPWIADCRSRNLGWRIDYAFVSESIKKEIACASISSNIFGSDHAPIELNIGK
ncbi:MAG: exodeoxyribonuclease III [Patescibacteria group bacterium]|jgi:exodeoxyribonuclease-3